MLATIAVLAASLASATPETADEPVPALLAEPLVPTLDERTLHTPLVPRELSKKERWLIEKARRPDVHLDDAALAPRKSGDTRPRKVLSPLASAEARLIEDMPPAGSRILPITTLYNIWNREAWPLLSGRPYKRPFQLFLRDRFTKEATFADTRLAFVLTASALRFHSAWIEVVSGYRSPKFNLMLRKKGHQVARESQHQQGTAVDFRVKGATTEALNGFVRTLRLGGVGYYPRTKFVHADTGKIRYWGGS